MKSALQTISLLIFTGIILTACHHNPASQSTTPAASAPKASYSDATKDTSNLFVDKNAKDGLNIIKYKNGVIKAKGYYNSGRKYGEWQSFYPDGKLWSDEYFTLGLPDGKITVWYDNNKKMYEGVYKNGHPIGTWSYWNEEGKLLRTSDYNKKDPNTAL